MLRMSEDLESDFAPDTSSLDDSERARQPRQLVEHMSSLDHDGIARLRNYVPALIENKHQIFGYLRKEDIRRVILQQHRLAILSRMMRGRPTLRSFLESEQISYIAEREVMRSLEGYERGQVNRTEQVTYNLTERPKRGILDRFLRRTGASR
jgi:hypothetical protein